MEVWENEKCCGNTSRRGVFTQLFQVLPNFHECFCNLIETRRTCFLFLVENITTKNMKIICQLSLSKCRTLCWHQSLHEQLMLALWCFCDIQNNQGQGTCDLECFGHDCCIICSYDITDADFENSLQAFNQWEKS